MKFKNGYLAGIGAAILMVASSAAIAADKPVGAADKKFAMEAAEGGMAEVEMGRVAVQNASNPDVKAFGQKMVDDHTKAGNELKDLAGKKNITLPTDLNAKHKAKLDMMSKKKGDAFDKAYMADMVMDHKQDVKEFQKESTGGSDPDLKSWAGTTLPTLQEHLKMAEDARTKVASK